MAQVNRQWLLRARPSGHLRIDDFEYREVPMPSTPLAAGEMRVRNVVFLCAPTMRNWMVAVPRPPVRSASCGCAARKCSATL